ncbi:YerC/YecD family TrpR-related protein [Alicyclobacillus tolerans]|uniref:TrpR-related protein YerC/YecD n=1 Tax=Alicyclobacillus tolerans TaxID=90970 RepID=A0ABT9LUN7_9BACL|nr:YerC/YecD family TrpR-related protein [Alicyclobacillus tengchongensis]MDP9727988.1 TrpR-related protein YerC/YecD [Alicyclobacillus tengchongensis]
MPFERLRDKHVDKLFQAVLSLETMDECYAFFEDLCTIGEIKSLAQRLAVAEMLQQGLTYHQIEAETGASTATISRVKRCLYYGADGYVTVLKRLQQEQTNHWRQGGDGDKTYD